MTADFEDELRDLFREKAGQAPLATPALPADAPRQVLRRGRLHQAGTVLGSAALALLLIVGSVAGLQRILGEGPDPFGSGEYEVFERTATIEAFTVTSPSDWYLVNQWPLSMQLAVGSNASSETCTVDPAGNEACSGDAEPVDRIHPQPSGLGMIQLSNVDVGLASNVCRDGLPADGAALYVALDAERALAGISDPSIRPFPQGIGLPPEGDGPCGPGRYAQFTVNGEPFFAWIGLGPDVTDEARTTVQTAYERMSAIEDWEPTPSDHTTPAYVIAGGTSERGETWRLELRPGERSPELFLERADHVLLSDLLPGTLTDSFYAGELTDPIFGAVTKDATGVEFRPGEENASLDLGGSPVPGTIVPVPPTLGSFDFDLFFIDPPQGYAQLGGHVIALGVDQAPIESPPPAAEPRDEVVEFSGTFEEHEWAVRFTGSFADRNACVYVDMDAERQSPLCPTKVGDSLASGHPSLHGWLTSFYLNAGSVPPEVVEIRFVGDDDAIVPTSFRCEMGPLGWTDPDVKVCALLLPVSGSGTVEYLDAAGSVIFEEGIGWGVAEPEVPTPVDPVHGGTYWGVYPWVGPAGSREADDLVASLFEEFGIQAHQGELACDQGAAEALGTGAEWRVAVFFETQAEANEFALQAGLLGHEADPTVAQVTTYCLD